MHEGCSWGQMEAQLGPDHPRTLGSRQQPGHRLLPGRPAVRGDRAARGDASSSIEAKLGPDHPDTLNSRNNLAVAYADAGRLSEAIALHEETLQLAEVKLGPDHPRCSPCRDRTGQRLRRGRPERRRRSRCTRHAPPDGGQAGPRPPYTLINRHNLAIAYAKAGRVSEAIASVRGDARADRGQAGPRPSLHAGEPQRPGRRPTSRSAGGPRPRACIATCWPAAARPSSPTAPCWPTTSPRSAVTCSEQSRWSEAEPLLREALAIREKATPDDWARYDAMSLLGAALLGQGRYAEAEPLIVAGYEGMKAREARIIVPERPRLREAAERVIRLYEAWGQPEEAAAWKARAGDARPARRGLRPAVRRRQEVFGTVRPLADASHRSARSARVGRLYRRQICHHRFGFSS